MKNIILVFISICLTIQINAQITINGKIIDSESKEGIPYVNIGIIKMSKGTVSDSQGKYELKVNSNEELITISSIGYETLNVKAKELKEKEIIELTSKEYGILGIEIEAKRFKEEELIFGVRNEKRGQSIGFGSAQLGTEIGSAIKIEKRTYIKSANFVLNHAKGDSLLFRINIYQFKDGKVGMNLLTENIIIKEKQRKGTITVDMQKYNLILESDVLLTLEWLRNFDEIGNKEITFDTKKTRKLKGIYVKYSSNGEFSKLSQKTKVKPCFYFKGKQSQ